MKLKSILLTAVATLGLTAATMAQVPNYVPTNGLMGWWPFNGNANDESGNGNNGTVSGATLTTDRFGNSNSAYNFDGIDDIINLPLNSGQVANSTQFSIQFWITPDSIINTPQTVFANWHSSPNSPNGTPVSFYTGFYDNNSGYNIFTGYVNSLGVGSNLNMNYSNWNHILIVYDGNQALAQNRQKVYYNGFLQANNFNCQNCSSNIPQIIGNVYNHTTIGARYAGAQNTLIEKFKGKIDEIGIWNRTLTQQEITDLFNSINCYNNTAISPQTNSLSIGSTANFTASTSDPNPSYVWQSDLGQGFQTLNNFGNYSGVNTTTLSIANVQLSEHNQPIRLISTSGNCIDTSNVAVINILDTCLVTVYDTLLTTVTDTLVINAQITGINPPNNLNTLKVYPNPASTHITIDYGNFNAMNGYTLKIVNSVGQTVFTTPINQQTSYLDLSTWTGNGIYYVQLIDPQNNTIENKKIVIQ